MNINELFPIGSVVLLKGGKKKVMIIGIWQTNIEDNKDYDYLGVLYPEGYMGDGTQFLFNHSDISNTYYYGFNDYERTIFINKLNSFYEDKHE